MLGFYSQVRNQYNAKYYKWQLATGYAGCQSNGHLKNNERNWYLCTSILLKCLSSFRTIPPESQSNLQIKLKLLFSCGQTPKAKSQNHITLHNHKDFNNSVVDNRAKKRFKDNLKKCLKSCDINLKKWVCMAAEREGWCHQIHEAVIQFERRRRGALEERQRRKSWAAYHPF